MPPGSVLCLGNTRLAEAEAGTDLKDGAARHPQAPRHRCHERYQVALRKRAAKGSWLAKMLAEKPRLLAAIALANKMARSVWAVLSKGEDYRGSALAPA